jgi:hypothetical protein
MHHFSNTQSYNFFFTDKLTEAQLLALVPPSITYNRARKWSITMLDSSWARSPHSVQKWDNFTRNASGMPVDDTIPQFHRPTFIDRTASDEYGVQSALQSNVFHILSATIGARQPSKEKFYRPSALERIQGNPDFFLQAGDSLIVPVEVKTKWILPDDIIVDIFDVEDPPVCVLNSIRQIFGYMAHNQRRYGVLSTYDKTWFIWRPENDTGTLFISDVVHAEDTSPTLLRCFAYIMSLARQDSHCPFPPPSPPGSREDYDDTPEEHDDEHKEPTHQPRKEFSPRLETKEQGSDRAIAGKTGITSKKNQPNTKGKPGASDKKQLNRRELKLEKFDWNSFEVTEYLGEGRCGTTFEGTLRGERVAIKLTDLWQYPVLHKEMLREARVYVKLGKLQGHGIPKLKGVGYTAGGLFALMTEFGGSPIQVENLDDKMREMIVGVLANIHVEGYLHGDVRCENILVEYCQYGPRIRFIDFGFSRRISRRKQSVCEMVALKKMIRFPKKHRCLE